MMRALLIAAIAILLPAHVRAQGALLETLDELRQVKEPAQFRAGPPPARADVANVPLPR